MALARLKGMLHLADGTSDIGAAIAAQLAGRGTPPVVTAGPPAASMALWGPRPNAALLAPPAPPGGAPQTAGMVPAAASAPATVPTTPAAATPQFSAPGPDGIRTMLGPASPDQIARWGIGGPGSGHMGVGPGGAAPMFPAPARPQISEAQIGEVNPNPGLGPGNSVDIMRAGRYAGAGIPLQARIGMMLMPAAGKAALSLLDASETTRQNRSSALLAKYNGDTTNRDYQAAQQQIDTDHQKALEALAYQQYGLTQLMQWGSTGAGNPFAGGGGMPTGW